MFSINNYQTKYKSFKSEIETDSDKFECIILYLHNNYMQDISIDFLVKKFSINRTYINDLFIQNTGKSIIKYLIELRIKLACLVLRDTLRPRNEVAYQSGFNDVTNFGRAFKKAIKLTPSQYREKYNWMII